MTLALVLGGCVLRKAAPTLIPTETTVPTPLAETQWVSLAPGLEQRVYVPDSNNTVTQMRALRIDPALYTFRAHYRPGQPLTLPQWLEELPGAVAFVNANFFTPQHEIVGMLVSDGVVFGASLQNLGGTFQVQNGQVRVRSNILEPYAGEPLEQAVQAYPMLVLNGTPAFTDTSRPDRFTRRTVVGQDANGRIILLATPLLGLPLVDLSAFLAATDLELINAFNLDGGGSTLMYVGLPGIPEYRLPSLDPVPAVLAVHPR